MTYLPSTIRESDVRTICGFMAGSCSFSMIPRISIKMHARDVDLLKGFASKLGGSINGPYEYGKRKVVIWQLQGEALRRAFPIIKANMPDCHRKSKMEEWERTLKEEGVVLGSEFIIHVKD